MGLPLIGLPQGLRIYLAVEPVNMRKQYDEPSQRRQTLTIDKTHP